MNTRIKTAVLTVALAAATVGTASANTMLQPAPPQSIVTVVRNAVAAELAALEHKLATMFVYPR